jgi:hypothetical protein
MESKKSLILFLDILGYCAWVKEAKSYETIYRIFNDLYFKHELFGDMAENENFTKGFKKSLDLYIVADSLVFVLNLEDEKYKTTYISIFLQYVAYFIMEFISRTGFLLRGGLAYGDFVLKDIYGKKTNIFIFSKAYNRAVVLEKTTKFPRIVIDDSFLQEFDKNYNSGALERGFLKFRWEICYFDYYYKMEKYYHPYLAKKLLLQIRNIITKVYHAGRKNFPQDVKEKYFYFSDYHNELIDRMFRAQLIETDFKKLKLTKFNVLKELEYLGIVESTAEFQIKKDVDINFGKIAQRISFGDFKGKHIQLAKIIKQRLELNKKEIKNLKINIV